jgi:hypothetical protein
LSSTTDHSHGQALAFFALALTAVILVAALAFDVGDVLLERRYEQNAADAAALHGARYVTTSDSQADLEARALATLNGFKHGVDAEDVYVNIPARDSAQWGNVQGTIEVKICNTRPSIFAGIAGILDWDVCARAVAAQLEDSAGPWSMIALHPTQCKALHLSGNGLIKTAGSIQVNSDCLEADSGALFRSGNGEIQMATGGWACDVVGEIKNDGKEALLDCPQNEGANYQEDPLAGIGEPPMPALAPKPIPVNAAAEAVDIPSYCQGSSSPATEADPGVCKFNGNTYGDTEWRLQPGLYPGGIELHDGTFYLDPGIYWIGGGGLTMVGGGAIVVSVESGADLTSCSPDPKACGGGGVLLFNTELPDGGAAGRVGTIDLGGSDATVYLEPLDMGVQGEPDGEWDRIVIYQRRDLGINGDDITINGSDSDMDVRGTIYAAAGDVKVNGSAGVLRLDLIIASTFMVDGKGQIEVMKSEDFVILFSAAGLVE